MGLLKRMPPTGYYNETDKDKLIKNIKCIRMENVKRSLAENNNSHGLIESILIVGKQQANQLHAKNKMKYIQKKKEQKFSVL
jgi:hypothetical protein